MKTSNEVLKKANIIPRLVLAIKTERGTQGTGPHKVKLISDKIVMGTEFKTGKQRHEVEYLIEENGKQKKYRVPVKDKNNEIHYLIQRLAGYNEGDEVILEYKRQGLTGYIDVKPATEIQKKLDETTAQIEKNEIPVIEEQDTEMDSDDIDTKDIPF